MLDGEVISAPNINEPIRGGSGLDHRRTLKRKTRAAWPARCKIRLQTPVVIEEERSASSTLGAEAIHSGIYAGIGGLAARAGLRGGLLSFCRPCGVSGWW